MGNYGNERIEFASEAQIVSIGFDELGRQTLSLGLNFEHIEHISINPRCRDLYSMIEDGRVDANQIVLLFVNVDGYPPMDLLRDMAHAKLIFNRTIIVAVGGSTPVRYALTSVGVDITVAALGSKVELQALVEVLLRSDASEVESPLINRQKMVRDHLLTEAGMRHLQYTSDMAPWCYNSSFYFLRSPCGKKIPVSYTESLLMEGFLQSENHIYEAHLWSPRRNRVVQTLGSSEIIESDKPNRGNLAIYVSRFKKKTSEQFGVVLPVRPLYRKGYQFCASLIRDGVVA